MQSSNGSGAVAPPPAPATPLAPGEAFLAALAARDYAGLEACFESEAGFRALVPSGLREGSGPAEAAGWLRRWFGDADEFHVEAAEAEELADRLHLAYRIRLRKQGVWYLVAQQAYCEVREGRIARLSLVCSGFRPAEP